MVALGHHILSDHFGGVAGVHYKANVPPTFLNQARAGRRPARTWFLEIDIVCKVCVCVSVCLCVRPRG